MWAAWFQRTFVDDKHLDCLPSPMSWPAGLDIADLLFHIEDTWSNSTPGVYSCTYSDTISYRGDSHEKLPVYEPPMFCAAMPVLAQIARHSVFLAYFFLRACMIALSSNDLPVPE